MNAEIIDQDTRGIGVRVNDNNGAEHTVAVGFDGEIQGHSQDDYPDDPVKRTEEEDERVSQARRYARYHVQRETEYDPVPWEEHIPRLEQTRAAIEALSTEAFEEYFGTYFDQLNGHLPTIDHPVEHPPELDDKEFYMYLLDVYLDGDGTIEATSDIHFQYLEGPKNKPTHVWGADLLPDRDPDARLQLMPQYRPSVEVGQAFFAYHLRCQIRDCYLMMGAESPQEYRVLGPGIYEATSRYMTEGRPYEPYHELHADIPGYNLDFDYGLGEQGKQIAQAAGRIRDATDDQ
ncbi:hypothetical protein [Halogeometricum borinquense]|nr:hypothetical protein [Halogeometricum borinquense]